jgi:hypothetical protein
LVRLNLGERSRSGKHRGGRMSTQEVLVTEALFKAALDDFIYGVVL